MSIMSGLIACRTGTRRDFKELLIVFCFYVTLFGLGSPWKADLAISADVSLFVQSYNVLRSRTAQNNHFHVPLTFSIAV